MSVLRFPSSCKYPRSVNNKKLIKSTSIFTQTYDLFCLVWFVQDDQVLKRHLCHKIRRKEEWKLNGSPFTCLHNNRSFIRLYSIIFSFYTIFLCCYLGSECCFYSYEKNITARFLSYVWMKKNNLWFIVISLV